MSLRGKHKRKPWKLAPERATLGGVTHATCRWDDNQKLTNCGIYYLEPGIRLSDPREPRIPDVDCMSCLVREAKEGP